MKTALVTGGSSGIGSRVCDRLVRDGWKVYEFSRHGQSRENVEHIGCDITDCDEVKRFVGMIVSREGRIDLIVNNAGNGVAGAVEFIDDDMTRRQFEVNVFGTVNVIRAVLPYMRQERSGRIINVSSVAAAAAIPFQAYYSASKAAINAFTRALANEVRPFGISVCAVMPGDTKTGFTASRSKVFDGDTEYCGRISKSVGVMEHDEMNGSDPDKAAKMISRIARKNRVKSLYTVGFQYKLVLLLIKILPVSVADFIIGKIYAS